MRKILKVMRGFLFFLISLKYFIFFSFQFIQINLVSHFIIFFVNKLLNKIWDGKLNFKSEKYCSNVFL